jgi:hypothetical protein
MKAERLRSRLLPDTGGAEEDRTPDLRIANATLSQLSYRPMADDFIGERVYVQPT